MLCGFGTSGERLSLHSLLTNVTLKLAEYAKPGARREALRALYDAATSDDAILHVFGLERRGSDLTSNAVEVPPVKLDPVCVHLHKLLDAGSPSVGEFRSATLGIAIGCRNLSIASGTSDMANVWFSRFTGLLASTCFQSNAATQGRAFSALAVLLEEDGADQEIGDDLLVSILSPSSHGKPMR
jgi:hypothetical protein